MSITKLFNFASKVKEIEKRDSVLTSKQQIDRLTRPGATYFNLNPFEVCKQNIYFLRKCVSSAYLNVPQY